MNHHDDATGHIVPFSDRLGDRLAELASAGPITVWYLGNDVRRSLQISADLPIGAVAGNLSDRLDRAADRIEQDLINLDAQVLGEDGDRGAWGASRIADRSPYSGDLQRNCARYLAIHDIVSEGGRHAFILDGAENAAVFAKTAQDNGDPLEGPLGGGAAGWFFAALKARASALRQVWRNARALRRNRSSRPIDWEGLRECDVLLFDWANSQTFSATGPTVKTWNLVNMVEIFRDAGLKVGFIANPLSWIEPFAGIAENVAASHDPVILVDDCRSPMDVVRSMIATWRMNRALKPEFIAQGINFSAIYNHQRRLDIISDRPTLAHSYENVTKYLAAHGVTPKSILYTFEHQGWERGFILGAKRHLPETRLIAYQHAPFAARYLSFYASRQSIEHGDIPDTLIVMGERYQELFRRHNFPADRLTLAGSIRFQSILNNPPVAATQRTEHPSILCSASVDFDESIDLAMKSVIATGGLEDARLMINFHPAVTDEFRQGIKAAATDSPSWDAERMSFSTDRVGTLLPHADVLLYNSSGTVFEAMIAGIPSIYVAIDGSVSYNKAPGAEAHHATGTDGLRDALSRVLSSPPSAETDTPDTSQFIAALDEATIVDSVRPA